MPVTKLAIRCPQVRAPLSTEPKQPRRGESPAYLRTEGGLNSGGIIQPVDRQSRKELGIEIRGLLRQYLAVESTISHRLNGRRVHQKAELRLSPLDLLHGGVEIAHVMQISLFPNSLRID